MDTFNSVKDIIKTKEDQRRELLRPSVNMASVMDYTKDNYFKYDVFKYGKSKQTEIIEEKKQRISKKEMLKS